MPMKIVHRNKGEAMRKSGVWLGNNERTEEAIIGTAYGVVKCRTFNRMSAPHRWDLDVILKIRGTPSEPVPGRTDSRTLVAIKEDGVAVDYEEAKEPSRDDVEDEVPEFVRKSGQGKLHVSRKAIAKYGPTDGCAACTAITLRGHLPGKLGHNHSDECRERIVKEMEKDPQYRELLRKHGHDNGMRELEMLDESQVQEMQGHLRKAMDWVNDKMKHEANSLTKQLNKTMLGILIGNMQVAEIYSPPRVAKMAKDLGPRAGWSLDLTTQDEDGRYWDFTDPTMRNRVARKVLRDKPMLLIGSPMCTVYSAMNRINHAKMPKAVVDQRFRDARVHLEFCTRLYNIQWEVGRYFLHEHPQAASSWSENCIAKMLGKEGALKTTADQCQYGLKSRDANGEGPARKSTSFMTNSPCIAARLRKQCPNKRGIPVHHHVRLEDGRTKAAQVYPHGLCKAICLGLRDQINMDKRGQFLLMEMDNAPNDAGSLMNMAKKIESKCETMEECNTEELEEAWDDVSGKALDPEQVKRARREEIDYVHKMGLYKKDLVSECYNETGKPPITVRWIDINKGDVDSPNYRSRLVAREINTYKRDDLFAATPPLEALKTILSMTTTSNKGGIVMVNDIYPERFSMQRWKETCTSNSPMRTEKKVRSLVRTGRWSLTVQPAVQLL